MPLSSTMPLPINLWPLIIISQNYSEVSECVKKIGILDSASIEIQKLYIMDHNVLHELLADLPITVIHTNYPNLLLHLNHSLSIR